MGLFFGLPTANFLSWNNALGLGVILCERRPNRRAPLRKALTTMADLRDQSVSEIPRLRRFAQGLVRNREIADDLVQDTLVRALTAEHRFQPGNVRVWLIVILINLNRNRIRYLARRGPHVGIDEIDQSVTPLLSAPTLDILMALEHLSEDQREVLLLVGLEGLS